MPIRDDISEHDSEHNGPGLSSGRETPLRILVVDDSRLQRRILVSSLRSATIEVVEAGSGEEALGLCREELPDIVLSDWMMPGMSGLDFCRELRELCEERYVYFIILTSKSEKNELAQALDEGADDFLSKPVSAKELRGRIAAGERLLRIERELTEKNRLISITLEKMRTMHEAINRDLVEARKLQMSLVPRGTSFCGGADVSFLMQPSGHVGGDLVGKFNGGDGQLGVFSLDVSGHGIAAALITARLSAWLSGDRPEQNVALTYEDGAVRMRSPEEICRKLNALFMAEIDTEHYFTILIADLDLKTGRARMCQAGHPHPLLIRQDGEMTFLGDGGMPVGLIEEAVYSTFDVTLEPGDRLLFYSDGITECPRPDGEMLDDDGLTELIARHSDERGPRLLQALRWEMGLLVEDGELPDDVSGALIEFHGQPIAVAGPALHGPRRPAVEPEEPAPLLLPRVYHATPERWHAAPRRFPDA